MRPGKTVIIGIACIMIAGCQAKEPDSPDGPLYFSTPKIAVTEISKMSEAKDWPTLARYYDLTDTPEDPAQLTSSEFFYAGDDVKPAHPSGVSKFKHPFAPGFTFDSVRKLDTPGVMEVTVSLEIDQGDGRVQRGIRGFLMRKTDNGYQVLRNKAPPFRRPVGQSTVSRAARRSSRPAGVSLASRRPTPSRGLLLS
jgi:hypothetical protein